MFIWQFCPSDSDQLIFGFSRINLWSDIRCALIILTVNVFKGTQVSLVIDRFESVGVFGKKGVAQLKKQRTEAYLATAGLKRNARKAR